jgi:hypothetical protein
MVRREMRVFIVLLLIVFLYAAIVCQARILGQHKVLPGPPAYNPQKIKQRMQYHGTHATWADNKGTWYFYRGDKVCVLYNPI